MNYPQEKYDEANDRLSKNRFPSPSEWDYFLSVFATVPGVSVAQWNEACLDKGSKPLFDTLNEVLAKQGPVIAAKPADGMVSLKDVEKVVFDGLCETTMMTGEIYKITDDIHKLLDNPKTPEPTVTLIDPTGGPSMDVPASAVHKMEYPEAVTVTYHKFSTTSGIFTVCDLCGVFVSDKAKHTASHERDGK